MRRRDLLGLMACSITARGGVPPERFSFIGDEVGPGPAEWIAFAKSFGLRNIELRVIERNGQPRAVEGMTPAEVAPVAAQLRDAGLSVSLIDSAFLKFTLPGTTPVASEQFYEDYYKRMGWTPEKMFAEREDRLQRALEVAHALGCKQLRTFSFWRIAQPRSVYQRLLEIFTPMGEIAAKAGCRLLLENEHTTNVGTGRELRDILAEVPVVAGNWDPQNSWVMDKRGALPVGSKLLQPQRLGNVHFKAEDFFGADKLDWPAMMGILEQKGYKGFYGLETHQGQRWAGRLDMAQRSMTEMRRIAATI